MRDLITVFDQPYLIKPDSREIRQIQPFPGMTVAHAVAQSRDKLHGLGFRDLVVTVNGKVESDWSRRLSPGDFIAVHAKHGFETIMGLIWLSFPYALQATGALAAGLAAGLTGALMIGAGLLINTFLNHPTEATETSGTDSPTYRAEGVNPTLAGYPVPTVGGYVQSVPPLIGSYRTVDPDNSMWQHMLFALMEGGTNNPITADSVKIGDELLTSYSDYLFGVTSGISTPTALDLAVLADKFGQTNHDRIFDRLLDYGTGGARYSPVTTTLIAFGLGHDPEDPPPGVVDTGTRAATWYCNGTAALTDDSPKFGTGCLRLSLSNDYIYTDDYDTIRPYGSFQLDMWVKFPNTNNRGLYGVEIAGNPSQRIGFGYHGGNLYMFAALGTKEIPDETNPDAVNTTWDLTLYLSGAWTPNTGSWDFLRVRRYYDQVNAYWVTQILAPVAGVLTVIASDIGGYIDDFLGLGDTLATPLNAVYQGIITQYFGKAWYCDVTYEYPDYDSTPEDTVWTLLSGVCDMDDIRFTRFGMPTPYDDTTIPTAAMGLATADLSDLYTITTHSKCNAVWLIIEFSNGLFRINDHGSTTDYTVTIDIGYRVAGTSGSITWETLTCNEARSTAVRVEHHLAFPTRDYYDVFIQRTTVDDPDYNSKQRSTCYLISFREVISIFQTYPSLQIASVSLKMSDKLNGNIPTVKVIHNNTLRPVASWDGLTTQTVDFTNPMWRAFDAFTNRATGRGFYPTQLIQTTWEEWEDWCAETVDGNMRCKCDLVLDEKGGTFSDQCLRYIEDVGRAKVVKYGDQWSVVIDKPKTIPSYTFGRGNIRKGSFSWEGYEDSEKVDAVEIKYWDCNRNFDQTSVIHKATWYETLTVTPKVASIELRGCNNEDQATREAIFRMQKTEMITRHGSLETFAPVFALERGDLIDIIHPTNTFGFSGRTTRDHTAASTIYIDQYITLATEDFHDQAVIYLINPDGEREEFDVTGPWDVATNYVTIDGTYTGSQFDAFAIGRPKLDKLAYQVVSKKLNPPTDKEMEYWTIEFVEYVDAMFYHANYGSGLVAI